MSYGRFKDLTRRTASDKIFGNKVFNIAKNPKYDGYQRDHVSMAYKFFDKRGSAMHAWSETLNTRNIFAGKKWKYFEQGINWKTTHTKYYKI